MSLPGIGPELARTSSASLGATLSPAGGTPIAFGGEAGKVLQNPLSVFADVKEEAGFARSGFRSLESRRPRVGAGDRAITLKLASNYIASAGGADILEGGTADRFLDRLREREARHGKERRRSRDAARALAASLPDTLGQFYPDTPHDQFALLVGARERLLDQKDVEGSLYAVVDEAIERLALENRRSVRAGFNVDERARRHADLDARGALMSLYRSCVLESTSMLNLYRDLSRRYGADSFSRVTRFLIGAAGDDLAAIGPSTERAALRSAVDVLHRLQTLVSVREHCVIALQRLARWRADRAGEYAMLHTVLTLQDEQWPLPSMVRRRARDVVEDSPQGRVAFHNQLCELVEQIPARAFVDEPAREQLIKASREARDEAVLEEEEEELPANASERTDVTVDATRKRETHA